MAAVGFVAAAQTKIAVEAPNIVGSDEQFNVTFIIEGEDRPSNFNWNPGDDFTLVWGPQRESRPASVSSMASVPSHRSLPIRTYWLRRKPENSNCRLLRPR